MAGFERQNGLGFRGTYFDFEDRAGNGMLGPIPLATHLDLYAIDLEVTQSGQFCSWNAQLSGGVRIAGIDQGLETNVGSNVVDLSRAFDGAGLTFALGMDRQLGHSCFSVYNSFRGSLLFGDATVDITALGPNLPGPILATVAQIPNQTIAVWEMQLGLQMGRDTDYGLLIARAGVEAQLWEQPPVVLGLLDDNVGLFGPSFSVTLER
jgi:hypothetical protein